MRICRNIACNQDGRLARERVAVALVLRPVQSRRTCCASARRVRRCRSARLATQSAVPLIAMCRNGRRGPLAIKYNFFLSSLTILLQCVLTRSKRSKKKPQQCGPGKLTRTRTITTPTANGGATCPTLTEDSPCLVAVCSCMTSDWTGWGACSRTCGGGTQSRTRMITSACCVLLCVVCMCVCVCVCVCRDFV